MAKGVARGALLISVVTIISRLMGFARWAAFSHAVGSTAAGSAYTGANALPNVVFEVAAGGALASVVVPLLAVPLADKLRGQASQIASALATWAMIVLLPLAGALALAAGPLAGLLISPDIEAASPGTQALAATLIRMFALQVPLYGLGVLAGGCLQAGQRFLWPALAPALSSAAVITVYLLFGGLVKGHPDSPQTLGSSAVALLGWGTTAGVAVLTLPLLVPLWRSGVRLRPCLRFPAGVARQAFNLALAGIGALLAQQASVLVIALLAGNYGAGGTLPTYYYAQALYMLPYAIGAVPLAIAAFPQLANAAAKGDSQALNASAALALRAVVAVSVAGAVALVAVAPALEQAFAALDVGNVGSLWICLCLMAPGLVGYGLMALCQRLLYAVHKGHLAALASALGWLTVALVPVYVLVLMSRGVSREAGWADLFTLAALGLGTSIGMTVAGIGLLVAVARSLGSSALAGLGRTSVLAVVAGVVGAVAGRLVAGLALWPGLGGAVVASLAGGLVAAAVVAGTVLLVERDLLPALRRW
ncbi:MAG: virulence factor MviN [Micrococcales bacterium]|nr:virulence factor MviN [Micrococcales bacterium]